MTCMIAAHACSSEARSKGVVELSPSHLGYILFMVQFIHYARKCKVSYAKLIEELSSLRLGTIFALDYRHRNNSAETSVLVPVPVGWAFFGGHVGGKAPNICAAMPIEKAARSTLQIMRTGNGRGSKYCLGLFPCHISFLFYFLSFSMPASSLFASALELILSAFSA